jgi:hypothetical protein
VAQASTNEHAGSGVDWFVGGRLIVTVTFSLYAQVSVAQRLVLGALGGARAVERRGAALPPPPVASSAPQPCRRSDLNFAPPWQHDQVVRQRALESSVRLFAQGSETNLAMSFMSSWERKARFFGKNLGCLS